MGTNLSHSQPPQQLTRNNFEDLLNRIGNLTPTELKSVLENLRYQGRPVHPDALVGDLGRRLNPGQLTWRGQSFNQAQFKQVQTKLESALRRDKPQNEITSADLDRIFNLFTTEPFTSEQVQVMLNNLQYQGESIQPPELLFGDPGFYFMTPQQRLNYIDQFSWNGRQFTKEKTNQLIERLKEYFNGQSQNGQQNNGKNGQHDNNGNNGQQNGKNGKSNNDSNNNDKSGQQQDNHTLSDAQVEELIQALIYNQPSDLLENIRYKSNPITAPGVLFMSCRKTHAIRCYGLYFTDKQLKHIRKTLKKSQQKLLSTLEQALQGDDQAYDKLKSDLEAKPARRHHLEEMKKVFHEHNLASGVEKMTLADHALYTQEDVEQVLLIISQASLNQDTLKCLCNILRWNKRQLSPQQMQKVLMNE